MTEIEQPSQNGIDLTTEEDEHNKSRPADIEADMREMERRKRVEAIMGSRLFREELERIVDSQIREGGASGILQQLSDMVGVPAARVGSVFKSSNCVLPINDIRGVESMGYGKGEKILRCKLAATFRLIDLYGWTQGLGAQITARLNADQELFLVNPFGLLFHEVTASSLNKVDMQGSIVEQGTTNFGINANQYILHSVVHAARPDVRCVIYIGCNPVVAVSSLKVGLVPLTKDSAVLGEIATHAYTGSLYEPEERQKLIRSLGPISKVLLLSNHGALCCGETIEEAFYAASHIVQACETQLKLLPVGLDNLVLLSEEARKAIYDASRKPPEGFDQKPVDSGEQKQQDNKERPHSQKPKWRVGGAEFEALMRMLDNAGFRTGYIYRHPLVKSDVPKPKNDIEVPPAVSSLGYLLEEEELYRQGIWKKSDLRKGGDRSRWLNSPNVYQKVEVLETGTPDPKKITKWVADGSPTHSTAVRIENALQFVPPGTNPKEFKKLQQLIKDNRRADKISAGPQSHILEGVTWDEANNRIKDANVSATGDHVVLMGAASKGIIQRGYQHNATVYKAPYAKNPFDSVTDDELNEYKKTVERKRTHGEYTDTDFSESEALSSQQTSGALQKSSAINAPSQSETEDASEPQVLRIETKQAPKPSQPEVVLSDATVDFLNTERAHSTSKKPPTGRDIKTIASSEEDISVASTQLFIDSDYEIFDANDANFLNYDSLNRHDNNNNKFQDNYYEDISAYSPHELLYDSAHYSSLKQSDYDSEYSSLRSTAVTPYRTYSHFGFNIPCYKQPKHKHVPIGPCKYIPKKRDLSFFDLFSSPRFVEEPEDNFARILQRKAFEYVTEGDGNVSNENRLIKRHSIIQQDLLDWIYGKRLKVCKPKPFDFESIVERLIPKGNKNLDPIREEEEHEGKEIALVDPSNFYNEINKLNYSEESKNSEYVMPGNVNSSIYISTESSDTKENISEEIKEKEDVTEKRSLMSRETRNSRKKEFVELWEDHINYHNCNDENSDDLNFHSIEDCVSPPEVSIEGNSISQCESPTKSAILQSDTIIIELCAPSSRDGQQLLNSEIVEDNDSPSPHNDISPGPTLTNDDNNNDEDLLNSMEKLILQKLECGKLDRSEGTIFNKIESSIRSKLTPSKSKPTSPGSVNSNNIISSSTPSSDDRSSDGNSFYSLNLSEVVRTNSQKKTKSTPRSPRSFTSTGSSSSPTTANPHNKPSTSKTALENLNRLQITTSSKLYKLKRSSSKSNIKTNSKPTSNSKKSTRRNFITENIMNVSMKSKQHKQNITSIFGPNPFGKCLPNEQRNLKIKIQQNTTEPIDNHEIVYSFQTSQSIRGSPRFWVSVSPKSKTKTKTKPSFKRNRVSLPNHHEYTKSKGIDKSLKELDIVTKQLNDAADRQQVNISNFGERIEQMTEAFDEAICLQDNITNIRQELHDNINEYKRHAESISAFVENED